jgi:hypothetical protein
MGPYEVGRLLGESRYVSFYEGRHQRLGIDVTLHRLRPAYAEDPHLRERFRRVAQVLNRLFDVNVISLHHYEPGDEESEPFLALERIRGQTLADFLAATGPLPPPVAMAFGCALGRVLMKVHNLGLIHRDVTPGHVTIDQDRPGRLVLSDFLWVLVPETSDMPPITRIGEVIGTLGYMAPEQARGESVDERVDVFSLGVFIYELITGRVPFACRTREEYLGLIERQDYVPAEVIDPRVSLPVAEVLAGCLRFDPDERWSTVAEIVQVLERELHEALGVDANIVLHDFLAEPRKYLDGLAGRMVKRLEEKAFALADEGHRGALAHTLTLALKWRPQDPRFTALHRAIPRDKGPVPAKVLRALLEQHLVTQGPRQDDGDKMAAGGLPLPRGKTETPLAVQLLPRTLLGPRTQESGRQESDRQERLNPKRSPVSGRWHRGLVVAASLVAGLVGFALGGRWGVASPGVTDLFAQPLSERPLVGRLTDPLLGKYLPYPIDHQGHAPVPLGVNLNAVGELKKRGNLHAVATALVIGGGPGAQEQAMYYLDILAPLPGEEDILKMSLAPSRYPDIDSDRAAILLSQGKAEEALRLADSVLLASPEHRAGEWNRALALEDVGATVLAVEAFEHIASHGETGWAREASERAVALKKDMEPRRREHEAMLAKGRSMVSGGPIDLDLWRRFPGYGRLFFYDAVRAATSAARVREFLPLAADLDRLQGGRTLTAYVQKIAAEPFDRRGPFAQTYARLASDYNSFDAKALEVYFAQLRASGQDDLLLGALVLTDRVRDHFAEYLRLARKSNDMWFELLAENEQANAEIARGDYRQAEERLTAASKGCFIQGMVYRCIRIELAFAQLYISVHALADAEAHVKSGMEWARETGDWEAETSFLRKLVSVFFYRDKTSLIVAFAEEAARRGPDSCKQQRYLHETRADEYLRNLRFEEARREILAAPLCGEPRTMLSSLIAAYLNREGSAVVTPEQLREDLAILSHQQGLSIGEQARISFIGGLLELQYDRDKGRSLLRQSISLVKRLPAPDVKANETLFDSYEELVFDAGKAGDAEEALRLLGEQHGVSRTSACAVGVLATGGRSLVVMRDMNNVARIHYEPRNMSPEINVANFIPADFKVRLTACPQVTVYSNPALFGRSQLLPASLAWGFWEREPIRSETSRCEENAMVIGDVEPPAELKLQRLYPWGSYVLPGSVRTSLLGLAATSAAVLTAMPGATSIVFNSHVPVDVSRSYIVLSPDDDRKYALTTDDLRQVHFKCSPPIFIASYGLPPTASYWYGGLSVPSALLASGSGPVFAAVTPPPEGEGRQFFNMVLDRMRDESSPAVALRDVRTRWLREKKSGWVKDMFLAE